MTAVPTVTETTFDDLPLLYRGKVRDIYQVDDDKLLLVATDRLSAFDCVLPTPIVHKGEVLTQLSAFWFRMLRPLVDNHLITINTDDMPRAVHEREELVGRSTMVRRTEVFPVECVVRGY